MSSTSFPKKFIITHSILYFDRKLNINFIIDIKVDSHYNKFCYKNLADVAEWQTHKTQNLAGAISCGFKSHHPQPGKPRRLK